MGLLLAPGLLAALLALSDVLYRRAAAAAPAFPFDACRKVWAHRGHAASGGENSLHSVQAAFDRGAAGVEIDILFDAALGDFVVSHDRPYALFDGQPLKLDTLLARHADRGFLWLDAKDLRRLSPWRARQATERLAALLQRHGLTGRALVESSHAPYLAWLAGRGVHTSYALSPNERKHSAPLHALHLSIMKLGYAWVGSGAISMTADRYTPGTAAAFGQVPVLLSTVNDATTSKRLSAIPAVKVILSDRDDYAVSACVADP